MARNLITWAAQQPLWVADSLRRIALAEDYVVSDDEIELIAEAIRHEVGLRSEIQGCEALSHHHLGGGNSEHQRVALAQLGPLENIDRLAPNQILRFAPVGITLIYGENGSGKSGYTRIAKKICRSLSVDDIRRNVFENESNAIRQVQIHFQIGDSQKTIFNWITDKAPPKELRQISVFDSRNARLYVDSQNKIAYLPHEVAILEHHGQLCRKILKLFSEEESSIKLRISTPLPTGYTPGSLVSTMLERLNAKSSSLPSELEIKRTAKLSEEETIELSMLERELAQDPIALAAIRKRCILLLNRIIQVIDSLNRGLSAEVELELKRLRSNADSTSAAVRLAAAEGFSEEKLPKIGSDAWRTLYEAARAFAAVSDNLSSGQLPDVQGAPCLLCQEPLSDEAAGRMTRFNAFVLSDASRCADIARNELNSAVERIASLTIPNDSLVQESLQPYSSLELTREALVSKIMSVLVNFERRKSSLLDQNLAIVSLPDTAEILSFLTSDIPKIEEEILQFEKVALHASVLDSRRARLGDLKDRRKLENDLDITLQRLSDLNLLTGVKKCIAQTNTRATSLQLSILRKDLITDELERRIQAEITALDLSHLPLQTKEVSSAGESLFSVGLKAASNFKNNQILSEGEQRALALACFLSEMGSDGSSYGLIVDDPVSSLDHNRVRKVAQRLIAEAEKGRQVIIFTHNIVFFNEIVSEASRSTNKIPLVKSVISKSATEGFGIIKEDCEPWIADVNERIKNLRDRAKSYRSETDFSDEKYRRLVKDFYSDLRETWERMVEEVVLAKTVVRFVPDVMTQRLREVCITDNDYKIIYFAMKRASERSGHDMAAGRNITAPTPAEIETDLKELDEFRIEYKKRSKSTSTARSALENAAKAEFI